MLPHSTGHFGTLRLIATGGFHDFVLVTESSKSDPITHRFPNTDHGKSAELEMAARDDAWSSVSGASDSAYMHDYINLSCSGNFGPIL